MFKRLGLAAIAMAFAVVSMPAASEAGHFKRSARPACGLTKLFHRVHRAPRVVAPVVHVRPVRMKRVDPFARLRKMFAEKRARLAAHFARPARVHHHRRVHVRRARH